MGALCTKKYNGYTLNSKHIVETTQKFKTMFAILLAIMLTLSILSSISANAADVIKTTTASDGKTTYTIDGESFTADECKNAPFGGFALKLTYLSYGGLFDVLQNAKVFSLSGVENIKNNSGSGVWALYGSLYDSVAAAGCGLALMWTMLNIIEKISEGKLTEELVLSFFAKSLLAAFIIVYGKDLCVTLLGLSNKITEAFQKGVNDWMSSQSESISAVQLEAKTKMQNIKAGNVFTCCLYIIEGLIPAIAMLVCWVLACVQLISRILELGIRTAFMPIGVADFMTHGTNSPGMKYLKSYLGCACQGAALYVILISGITLMNSGNIFSILSGNTSADAPLANIYGAVGRVCISIVIAITMLGLMKRVDSILKEVFS